MCPQHTGRLDVMGIMVRDPRDRTLPEMNRMVLVEHPFLEKQLLMQPELIRKKYSSYVAKQESRIKDLFKKTGAGFVSLSTDKDFLKPIMEYFIRRLEQFV